MKIIIDLQGLQREGNRKRGIGRYCLEITKALIHNYPKNEYILFTNSALFDLRKYFFDELNNQNFNLIYFQCPTVGNINEIYVGRYSRLWLSTQLRSYALSAIRADIILITSFFDGFRDNTLVSHDNSYELPPVVSIIYDLIPLIHNDQYLNVDPEYKLFYLQKIEELSRIDGLLAISQSSLREASKYLNINPETIYNISSACNEKTFSLQSSDSSLDSTDEKYLGRFLLYCGATDPRKNLCRLIEAYASLPLDLIFKHKLVLIGPYTDEEIVLIKEWMITFGLPPEYVIFLGYISDSQLANLYRSCYLFIFPSLHEGFGLPVLEAMNCGAPVIASNVTSLPELIGNLEYLFDPYNSKEISSLIYKCLTNNEFHQKICANSLKRRKYFSWAYTAERTIDSLQEVIDKKGISLNKSNSDFISFINNQYDMLVDNIAQSPLIKAKSNSNSEYLKLLASAISIVNSQSKKIQLLRDARNEGKFTWQIEGPFDSSYSLAILNRNYALAMDSLGQNVKLYSTEGPGDYEPNSSFLDNTKIVKKLYSKVINSKDRFFICTRNLYPPRVHDVKAVINLLHAYGWEESMFPSSWVDHFNSYLTGITAMSSEVKKILIDNGVYVPITVCGLGVDHIDQVEPLSNYLLPDIKFSFLHVSSCFPRKGIECLLSAYFQSFNADDEVILIIKTFENPHNNIKSILNDFINKNPNAPEVLIIDKELSLSEIKSLYLSSNAVVAPSYGEGFNLTVAEAMRLGVPVITTGWGGQTDFCNASNSWLIDFSFEYSNTHLGLFSSVWARPSVSSLSKLMKECYASPQVVLKQKTQIAKESIMNLTWQSVAKKNIDFVYNLLSSSFVLPTKIGWVTTWDSRCGIATYSHHLIEHIQSELIILAPENEHIEDDYKVENVKRCWSLGEDNLDKLYQIIIDNQFTSVVIQFNYGFYDFLAFKLFINKLYHNNIKIILFMHSTLDPPNQSKKCLFSIVPELKLCDRILVHSPADLNRLKQINLLTNVSLFPHGVLDFSPKVMNQISPIRKEFHISTYGFCLPNKGLIELIKAVNILQTRQYNIKLTLHTALYQSELSIQLSQEIKSLIRELDLGNYIFINHDFVSHEETLLSLSNTDLVVFPYQSSNESASGAVRQGIASTTPVAVTPLPIFEDVSEIVYTLPGFTPEDIAEGIISFFENDFLNSSSDKSREWIKAHKFSQLSIRLFGLIRSLEINS